VDDLNKTTNTRAQAGKYLTFQLASEVYGLEVLKVHEIIGMMPITRVPKMPIFIRGIINLRGKLIPVIDMREKFSLIKQLDTAKTCIIVVQIKEKDVPVTIGILVDAVAEVLDIPANHMEPTPSFGSDVNTQFILGIGKIADKVVMLLDIDKILTESGTITTLTQMTITNEPEVKNVG
jgi:purine-binding chemotaxis protein CheW